jgi:hypothetical protein
LVAGRRETNPSDPQGSPCGMEWLPIGDSKSTGPMNDGRLFRIWDTDGDGKMEILFRSPRDESWIEGKVNKGSMQWRLISLQIKKV